MHDLAIELGMTTGNLSVQMTEGEFQRWIAYYNKKPFGAERDNYHAALLCALLVNINRGKGQPAAKVADFMYKDASDIRKTNIRQTMAALNARAKK